jgi:hypothetical protein
VFESGQKDWETIDLKAKILQIADIREFAATTRGKKAADFSTEHDLGVQEALLQACGMTGAK